MSDALVLEGVHCARPGRTAVRNVHLRLGEAESLAVLGPSGSGKSVLLALCGGRLIPDQGRITLAGRDLTSLGGRARRSFVRQAVGWVGGSSEQDPLLTIEENLLVAAGEGGAGRVQSAQTAEMAMAATSLADRARHLAGELSGGEARRLAIAVALARAPAVLIVDEPTGPLDRAAAAQVLELLRQAADSGIAVLLATHDPAVARVADRVVEVAHGELVRPPA